MENEQPQEAEAKEEPVEEQPKELTPIEELAKEIGWNPDFAGDNAVDAKTYILRGRDIQDSLNKRVSNLSKELTAVKEGVEVVRWSAEQSRKQEVDRLKAEIKDLKARRREAIQDGDADAVEAFDGKIKAHENAVKGVPAPKPNGSPPEFDEWVKDNKWYLENNEMQRYANALHKTPEYQALLQASYPRMLKKIEAAVKKEFPEAFPTEKKDPPPAVSGTTQRVSKKTKQAATAKDLSYEQKKTGTDFVNMGIYKNLDEYAKDLQERNK